jgi:membrane-bound ClpP family serine protease
VLLRNWRSVFEFRTLLLLSSIAAFVIGFIILITFGRSYLFISPRYGTVLVWSSMLGLLALAVGVRLMEAFRSSLCFQLFKTGFSQ